LDLESKAEKMFCRLVVHNKLIEQSALDQVLSSRSSWKADLLPDELLHRKLIKGGHLEKVKKAVLAKGLKFPAPAKAKPVSAAETKENTAPAKPKKSHVNLFPVENPQLLPSHQCAPEKDGRTLVKLLNKARDKGASDLHITVGAPAFYRAHGIIERMDTPVFTDEQTLSMLTDVLLPEQKEKLFNDLQLDFSLELPDGSRFRSNIVKERVGWAGCFRIVANKPPSFKDLDLPEPLKLLTEYPTGLVLVTGPMGSGKTTTLAAMVDLINMSRKDHIITVEDPIEYRIKGKGCQVTQRGLGAHTLSFANSLKGALRQDPDVIMIGEMRDLDTISIAITAAETGHLVFGSMHTSSADRTIDRIISSFPPDQQAQIRVMIADSIRGVVCQQLLPRADGKGAVLALEILMNNISVRKCIIDNRTFQLDSIIQTGKKQGMIRMDDSILDLLNKGLITRETAKTYIRNPANLK